MRTRKLTRSQYEVVERMGEGEALHCIYCGNRAHRWILRRDKQRIMVRRRTFVALNEMGLIDVIRDDWSGADYTISDTGRAVLQAQEQPPTRRPGEGGEQG